jgi:squalene-hopene/tetraprenyl-beta-curcumene cyclase
MSAPRSLLALHPARLALSAGLLSLIATAGATTRFPAPAAPGPVVGPPAVPAPQCSAPASPTLGKTSMQSADPKTRAAAQKGLDWLAQATVDWQARHSCYGCHVQAVTVDALAVGSAKGYRVKPAQLAKVLAGVTDLPGGARNPGGLGYHGGQLRIPSKAIGGAAFARFDSLVDGRLRDELLTVAAELQEAQAADGHVEDAEHWTNAPVGTGRPEQWTALGVQVWRQAYERSGDERWLTAAALAEDWLAGKAAALTGQEDLQQVNYTLMGLLAGGAGAGERSVSRVAEVLEARQNEDGGWSLQGGASDPLATGQTLSVLRQLGRTDADPTVARGTAWLVRKQLGEGAWGTGGEAKAEAMWAVLGLVSVDALTVELTGVQHGQHVSGTVPLTVQAADNGGAGVRSVELFVDDIRVDAGCTDGLTWQLPADALSEGAHIIDVLATSGSGAQTRRRLTVYAGDWYLTRPASRWEGTGTRLSVRNIAEETEGTTISVEVKAEGGASALWSSTAPASQGAWSTLWSGEGALPDNDRYVATLTLRDAEGRTVQTLEERFVHATPESRSQAYGEVAGRLNWAESAEEVANAVIELVDGDGNVVESTRSTANGAYRFKDVAGGQYKVRVKKEGQKAQEAEVLAAPAAESSADFEL